LRWALLKSKEAYNLKFIDDTGKDQLPEIHKYSFSRPCSSETLDFKANIQVTEGGLFSANKGDYKSLAIVPPIVHDLQDLSCSPKIESVNRSPDKLVEMMGIAGKWGIAKCPGDVITSSYLRKVLSTLRDNIILEIAGRNWSDAEQYYRQDSVRNRRRIQEFVTKRPDQIGAITVIAKEAPELIATPILYRVFRLSELMLRYNLVPHSLSTSENELNAKNIAELCLRISSDVGSILECFDSRLREAVVILLENPVALRIARYFVLITSQTDDSVEGEQEGSESWVWD